jgi:hypothetical protein
VLELFKTRHQCQMWRRNANECIWITLPKTQHSTFSLLRHDWRHSAASTSVRTQRLNVTLLASYCKSRIF